MADLFLCLARSQLLDKAPCSTLQSGALPSAPSACTTLPGSLSSWNSWLKQSLPDANTELGAAEGLEVAEGAPAAGTEPRVGLKSTEIKDSWWGCQSHQNNRRVPTQQRVGQEFQHKKQHSRFRKPFKQRSLPKRGLNLKRGKNSGSVCVCREG